MRLIKLFLVLILVLFAGLGNALSGWCWKVCEVCIIYLKMVPRYSATQELYHSDVFDRRGRDSAPKGTSFCENRVWSWCVNLEPPIDGKSLEFTRADVFPTGKAGPGFGEGFHSLPTGEKPAPINDHCCNVETTCWSNWGAVPFFVGSLVPQTKHIKEYRLCDFRGNCQRGVQRWSELGQDSCVVCIWWKACTVLWAEWHERSGWFGNWLDGNVRWQAQRVDRIKWRLGKW